MNGKLTINDIPINPRTGYPYKRTTKKYKEWFESLSEDNKKRVADVEYDWLVAHMGKMFSHQNL